MSNSMIIEVLELLSPQGQKTGNWRLTIRTDEKANPCGLCTHTHNSYDDAWNCLEAWEAAKRLSGDSPQSRFKSWNIESLDENSPDI